MKAVVWRQDAVMTCKQRSKELFATTGKGNSDDVRYISTSNVRQAQAQNFDLKTVLSFQKPRPHTTRQTLG